MTLLRLSWRNVTLLRCGRPYDADPEHNRIRREMFAPLSASIERVQFRLPGPS